MYKLYVTYVSSCYEERHRRIYASACHRYGWNVCRHGRFPGRLSLPPLPLSRRSLKPFPLRLPPRLPRLPFPPSPFACAGSTEIRRPSTSKPIHRVHDTVGFSLFYLEDEKLSRKSIRPIRTLPGTHLLTNSIS